VDSTLKFAGDGQADLRVHGGTDKAVYYSSEYYELWSRERPELELGPEAFGENLTTEGLIEDVSIGDRFRVGTAELVVTQPRLPCFKLGITMAASSLPSSSSEVSAASTSPSAARAMSKPAIP
jgi:MOSC domain-containing protein YiiM